MREDLAAFRKGEGGPIMNSAELFPPASVMSLRPIEAVPAALRPSYERILQMTKLSPGKPLMVLATLSPDGFGPQLLVAPGDVAEDRYAAFSLSTYLNPETNDAYDEWNLQQVPKDFLEPFKTS